MLSSAGLAAADEKLRGAQDVLKVQGYFFGEVNGEPSDETTQALKRFQVRNLLPVTGALDEATARVLEALAAGKKGSSTPAVAAAAATPPPPAAKPSTPPVAPGAGPAKPSLPLPSVGGTANPQPPATAAKSPAPAAQAPAAAPSPATVAVDRSAPGVAATPVPATEPTPAVVAEATPLPTILRATPTPTMAVATHRPPPAVPAAQPAPASATIGTTPGQAISDRAIVVSQAQQILQRQGFYQGAINGARDSQFFRAVQQFQRAQGLAVSGELDQATMDGLGMDRARFAPPPKIVRNAPRERAPRVEREQQPELFAVGERVERIERPERPRVVRAERVPQTRRAEPVRTVVVETIETVRVP